MLIIAKTVKGKEFIYSAKSARQVSQRSAITICDICNQYKYQITDSEIWHVYEIDCYDTAYTYAQSQAFKIRKGIVSDCII